MKSAEDKAMEWANKHKHHGYNRMVRSLAILLMEQDRDTRHACAEKILTIEYYRNPCGDQMVLVDDAHKAIMNTKSA